MNYFQIIFKCKANEVAKMNNPIRQLALRRNNYNYSQNINTLIRCNISLLDIK